jgi:hypothetical protein
MFDVTLALTFGRNVVCGTDGASEGLWCENTALPYPGISGFSALHIAN